MHIHFLDPYRSGISVIHQLDPRIKLVLTLAFIFTIALMPLGAWAVYVLVLALVVAVELLSDLGILHILKRASLALPFMLAALPLIFTTSGTTILTLPLGPWTLTITAQGIERFASIAVKSWLSVQLAIVLAATTPFPDLLIAMRAIKIPRLLVAIFGLMWRYLFVLADEALRLMRARAARSGVSKENGKRVGGSLLWRARVTGGMAGNLFLRSFERGDRIYMAMAARGYDGEVRALLLPPLSSAQWMTLGAGLALCLVLLLTSFLFGG